MFELITENSFKRDFRKSVKRGQDMGKLDVILELLVQGKSFPEKNRNHKLKGEYVGYWECHVAPDWLLVYKKTSTAIILSGLGSHSDLFKRS